VVISWLYKPYVDGFIKRFDKVKEVNQHFGVETAIPDRFGAGPFHTDS
jgi:hypothetical protein